ncbi:ead/Ea22-like family protein [Microbacterium sp. kSW2-24]|uniref:ead/Ea22-like family protein n=1 Tax=Microbacterium galbinum TaxID=2851646 RepID=UPI001FFD51A3|nr:ead/Ea22-like family protein [Microbacterium galbinum]MCK2024590.1 ead/Ea22-like family protein [Microbacterium galbinum]
MTRTDLDALEAIARAATPGPWLTTKTSRDPDALCVDVPDGDDEMSLAWDAGYGIIVMSAANAAHVAATNPASTLALIAELRAERQRADAAIEYLDARWEHSDHTAAKYWRRMREAEHALEAVEKAHTPTDDEREALIDVLVMTKLSDYAATDMSTIHQAVDAILAAGFRRSEVPEPSVNLLAEIKNAIQWRASWPSMHWPNLDALAHHDVAQALADAVLAVVKRAYQPAESAAQGEPSDTQAERARIIADLREWSRPLGNSPEEETLRLVIARIERAAGGVR